MFIIGKCICFITILLNMDVERHRIIIYLSQSDAMLIHELL